MKLNQFYDDIVEYHSLHELLDRFYDAREREKESNNVQMI